MQKLDAKAFGLACGILWSASLFIMGIVNIFSSYGEGFVESIGNIYIGYAPTAGGCILGAIWGFIDAFIGGAVLAWLYNKIAR